MNLWLRHQCWLNDICYKHGCQKEDLGRFMYCPECRRERATARLNKKYELIQKVKSAKRNGCPVPPSGWYCLREAGHEGPCAAVPNERA